jgi:Icc-related predicted phosphoesterase
MKILHLSDLHFNQTWLDWATHKATNYDLVCVSGDLLDMFSRKGHFWGVITVKKWTERFPTNLALCSGNHDGSSPDRIPDTGLLPMLQAEDRREAEKLLLLERWMDALERPGLITDNRTRLVETASGPVVVTTLPYNFWGQAPPKGLLKDGGQLRKECNAPWIVLHHEPPSSELVGGFFGNRGLSERIVSYSPDFVLSGHIHLQPYRGDFAERLGRTWCFNPGAPDEIGTAAAAEPNHIVIDTVESTATWHFTNATGVARQKRIIKLRR